MNPECQAFRALLKNEMKRAGVTAGVLADELGVSKSSVLCWTRGRNYPKTHELLDRLCGIFPALSNVKPRGEAAQFWRESVPIPPQIRGALEHIRNELGASTRDMARLANISYSTYIKVINGGVQEVKLKTQAGINDLIRRYQAGELKKEAGND